MKILHLHLLPRRHLIWNYFCDVSLLRSGTIPENGQLLTFNSFLASGDFCRLSIAFAKSSVLSWI